MLRGGKALGENLKRGAIIAVRETVVQRDRGQRDRDVGERVSLRDRFRPERPGDAFGARDHRNVSVLIDIEPDAGHGFSLSVGCATVGAAPCRDRPATATSSRPGAKRAKCWAATG